MPLDAILDRRLLIVSGKGGVGKTTISAALGVLAARLGKNVLVCEVEGKQALGSLMEADELSESPRQLRPNLYGMQISATNALEEYFEIQFHMKRIAKPLISSQLVYYVTHAAPGLRDILMLGKVWHEATRRRHFDLIILDTPASGHAVSMLRSPQGFLDAVPIGPLANHARQVIEWLRDPDEVSIHLVSMAEEMPVAETIETTKLLEDRLDMDVANIYINMLYPSLFEDSSLDRQLDDIHDASQLVAVAKKSGGDLSEVHADALLRCAEFYRTRYALQQEHRSDLTKALESTADIVSLPFLFAPSFGLKQLDGLADVIEERLA